jgi:hypothetical protein
MIRSIVITGASKGIGSKFAAPTGLKPVEHQKAKRKNRQKANELAA